jgi:hypothetical protein
MNKADRKSRVPSRRARWFGSLCLLLLTGLTAAGCSQSPPPPDKLKMEQEAKQLDEHRQKEWGNE